VIPEQDRKTFLILEDDANDAILIRRAFMRAGCNAFICRNTSEARAYLLGAGMYSERDKFPSPEIFVLDIRLGEESGVDFLAWLRSKNEFRDLTVIVLSGAATPEDVRAVKRLGVSNVLQKPSDPIAFQDLLAIVSRELCRHSAHPWDDHEAVSDFSETWKTEHLTNSPDYSSRWKSPL
jgi:DNA-binding response OmpR family regulator